MERLRLTAGAITLLATTLAGVPARAEPAFAELIRAWSAPSLAGGG